MPKISLIGWVWNFTLFWQLISCYELSSCHKKKFTPEMDWGIAYLTVCQKSVCLVEFEICPYFDSLSVVTSCQAVINKLTSEIDWGIAYLTVCQKSVWLVEFEIQPYFDSLSVVMSSQDVSEKIWLQKLMEE